MMMTLFWQGHAWTITTINKSSDEGFLRAQTPEVNEDMFFNFLLGEQRRQTDQVKVYC